MANKPVLANAVTIALIAVALGFSIGYRTLAKAKAMARAALPVAD